MGTAKLTEDVFWVGAVDWDVRDFHGYETRRGTTYNAYLIMDDKTVLVDTVKYPFKATLARNIQELMGLENLDYLVINHVEIDHASSLSYIMQFAKKATMLCSRRAKDGLAKYYGANGWTIQTVKTGDELRLGDKTLKFIEAPMLHWPDSMFTYLEEDRILLPNDAFGQHLATSQRFDDEVDQTLLMEEAAKYYANILMPYAPLIPKKIEELPGLEVEPRVIAPSHGVIWRHNPGKIVNAYLEWSRGEAKEKAVIVYDSMWGSTQTMASAISEGMAKDGIEVRLMHLRRTDHSEVMKEILEAKAVVVGSPTLNSTMFPTVSGFLTYAIGLRPKGKVWASFGSYGWGGGAVKAINQRLSESGFEVLEPSLQVQWAPSSEELQKCREFGEKIAERVKS